MTRKDLIVQMLVERGAAQADILAAFPASMDTALSVQATPEDEMRLAEQFAKLDASKSWLFWIQSGMKGDNG